LPEKCDELVKYFTQYFIENVNSSDDKTVTFNFEVDVNGEDEKELIKKLKSFKTIE